jgi:DNA-binding MarR family transcriptional regulator
MTNEPGQAGVAWALLRDLVLDNERRREVGDALGMSFGRIKALRRIAAKPMPMGELATTLGIDPPYMTIVVDDLQAQGLVERRPHPTDRRAKLVVATRKGKEVARRAEAILSTPPRELTELDDADLAELVRILSR